MRYLINKMVYNFNKNSSGKNRMKVISLLESFLSHSVAILIRLHILPTGAIEINYVMAIG